MDMEKITKPKRKTHTSAAVKNRYNAKHYKQFQTRIKPELAAGIEEYMAARGITRPQFLAEALERAKKEEGNF